MILNDRISDIYQNYSLCDDNCEYNNMNISSMLITCSCEIKTEIESKKPDLKFDKIYLDLFSETSFGVIKCFKLVFNFKNKLNNIEFIIYTILVFLHIPFIIIYSVILVLPIYKYIINEMDKYKYLPKLNSPVKKDKKDIYKNNNNLKGIIKIINQKSKNQYNKLKNKRISRKNSNNFYKDNISSITNKFIINN